MENEEDKMEGELDKLRLENLKAKAEYDRLMAEIKAITYQLEDKHAEEKNGEE